MNKQPTISVIIPNYNNAQFLVECIESVFAQSYQPLECIVVDDGSTDNSLAVLNHLSQKHSKLRIFEQINSGPSVARNLGIKHAIGEYIALLDADDYWGVKKLENQKNAILDCKNNNRIFFSKNELFTNENKYPQNIKKLPPYTPLDFIAENYITGSCSSILFSKKVFIDCGGFDPSLWFGEDTELWFRMALHGKEFSFINERDVCIRRHLNNSTYTNNKIIYYQLLVLEKEISLLKKNKPNYLNDENFEAVIIARLGKINYWAKKLHRTDIRVQLILFGYKILGCNYLIFYLRAMINNIINNIFR